MLLWTKLEAALHKKLVVRPPPHTHTHWVRSTTSEVRTNSSAKFFNGLLHMDTSMLANQQNLHSSSLCELWMSFRRLTKNDGLLGRIAIEKKRESKREKERERERERERESQRSLLSWQSLMIYIYIHINLLQDSVDAT